MPPPFIPTFPRKPDDPQLDIETIMGYLYDIDAWLSGGDPGGIWTTSGLAVSRNLVAGATLGQLTDVVATLIETLKEKGIL